MSDPTERSASPRSPRAWPLVLLLVLSFVAMRYVSAYGGGFSNQVFAKNLERQPLRIPSGPLPPHRPPGTRGKGVYWGNCMVCHQSDGKGIPGQFPPLAGSDWVEGVGPDRMIRIVLHGLQGTIVVNGKEYTGAMVPFGGVLTDREIADVVSYVRNAWGNEGTFVDPELVRKIRMETAFRPYSPEELLALPHGAE